MSSLVGFSQRLSNVESGEKAFSGIDNEVRERGDAISPGVLPLAIVVIRSMHY